MGEKGRYRENDGERERLGRESAQTGLGLKSIALHDDGQEKVEANEKVTEEETITYLNEQRIFLKNIFNNYILLWMQQIFILR